MIVLNKKCGKCGNDVARRGYGRHRDGRVVECSQEVNPGYCSETEAYGFNTTFCTKCGVHFPGIIHMMDKGKEYARNEGGSFDRVG